MFAWGIQEADGRQTIATVDRNESRGGINVWANHKKEKSLKHMKNFRRAIKSIIKQTKLFTGCKETQEINGKQKKETK